MGFFARAVISGFGMSLGKALFDKVKDHIGLGDEHGNGVQEVPTEVVENDAGQDSDATYGPATELESLERVVH